MPALSADPAVREQAFARFRQVERRMEDTHDGVILSFEDGMSMLIRDILKDDLDSGHFML